MTLECSTRCGKDKQVNKGLSMTVFRDEYCAPVRHAEQWIASKKKEFGKLAELPAFARVREFLYSKRARPLILGCIRAGLRLEGVGPGTGIEQCSLLMKELLAAKHGQSPTNGHDPQAAANSPQDGEPYTV